MGLGLRVWGLGLGFRHARKGFWAILSLRVVGSIRETP